MLKKDEIPLGRAEDLTGQRFHMLTPLYRCKPPKNIKNRDAYWMCKCDCGNLTKVRGADLKDGSVKSCGCLVSEDLTGQRFDKLTVIERTEKRKNYQVVYLCRCDCGSLIEVVSGNLKSGNTKSCGCMRSKGEELIAKILKTLNIIFEKEKTFKKCKDKSLLRFDFYLPLYNLCIEYDGIQYQEVFLQYA